MTRQSAMPGMSLTLTKLKIQGFVHRDNQAFAAECDRASSKPATPTKRKVDDTYNEDNSINDPDPILFPAYQPDPVSTVSPSKKLNGGATTTTRDLSRWDVSPPSYDTALSDPPSDSHRTAVEMSSPPRNKFTSINEHPNSSANSNPYISNPTKQHATTAKNNPFFKPRTKPPGFDDMIPVSLTASSPPLEVETTNTHPGETMLLDNDEDMVMHQRDYAGTTSDLIQSHEMQERGGNRGILQGVGRGVNPYQSERQMPDLIMYDDSDERKGG